MLTARLAFVIGLLVSALLAVPMTACAQSHRLIVSPLDGLLLVKAPGRVELFTTARQSQPLATRCRAGRRVLIGALIGAGASTPLAKLVHTRFENEAANGTAAAATTVVLGAAVGALVGLATCN